MEEKFLRWFKRHHYLVRTCCLLVALTSAWTLFYDVLAGDYLRQFFFCAWFFIFTVPGHVVLARAICNLAESRNL